MHTGIATNQDLRSCRMPDGAPIVYVVDDDISIRESLEFLILTAGWVPRLFASAQEFLAHPRAALPSCLILDVSLPDLDGLELQKRITIDRAVMPIIFITGHADIPMSVRAMKAGAVEFLTKPYGEEVLLNAITSAIQRSRSALGEMEATRPFRDCYETLSRREREVMRLVITGLMNKQIAAELGISQITVKAHRGRMMRKMKARSLAELVKIASHLGQGG